MPSATDAAERTDIWFESEGVRCAAMLFRPAKADGAAPAVVLGHGFGAIKEGRLDAYGRRFADAGLVAMAFDYRHLGGSRGEPRQLIDIARQQADYRAAVTHVRGLEWVDPARVAAWGYSFGAGHAICTAAGDEGLAAVVAQAPFTDGTATLRAIEPRRVAWLAAQGLIDRVGALSGRPPHTVPVVGPAGSMAALTADDAANLYPGALPDGVDWRNEVAARVMTNFAFYRPVRVAGKVRCPMLVQVGTEDHVNPPGPSIEAAERAPRGELITYPLRHFDIYDGEPYERAVSDQIAFLTRHLL
jgi:dienelactone hydrolase